MSRVDSSIRAVSIPEPNSFESSDHRPLMMSEYYVILLSSRVNQHIYGRKVVLWMCTGLWRVYRTFKKSLQVEDYRGILLNVVFPKQLE